MAGIPKVRRVSCQGVPQDQLTCSTSATRFFQSVERPELYIARCKKHIPRNPPIDPKFWREIDKDEYLVHRVMDS